MGEYKNAENDFIKATELNPNSHIAWSNLGFIYRQEKDYTKALSAYQTYLGEIKSAQRDEAATADDFYKYD